MSYADLTADDWHRLADGQASSLAREIADRHDLRLAELGWHEYAGTGQRLAIFERAGLRFALVPGGRPVLGYDGNRFQPTPTQAASYGFSAAEYGLPSLAEHVDRVTSPVRSVELPAMLVAVEPYEPCAQNLSLDDPRVQQLVANARHRPGGRAMVSGPAGKVEVRFGEDGQVSRAREMVQVSYDSAVQRCAQDGLRLSTPDEWEYACGAGASTLFRWGDETPAEGYPEDHPNSPHREPNRWGLAIGQDPYRHEWTSERTVVCGGDGGGMVCGGSGFFLGWLTIATAYRDVGFGEWLNSEHGYVDEILVRPIIDLS